MVQDLGPVPLWRRSMPTAFEIAMAVLATCELALFALTLFMAFPNSQLYHYFYDGDELFNNRATDRAHRAQLKRSAFRVAFSIISACFSGFRTISSMARASAEGDDGSTNTAPSPAISGRDDAFEVITGTPILCASITGSPKPS